MSLRAWNYAPFERLPRISRKLFGTSHGSTMAKRSIMNLVGSAEGLALMQQAVIAAAKQNREAGVATATVVNGKTVVIPGKVTPISAAVRRRS